jgi:hypothetical protein
MAKPRGQDWVKQDGGAAILPGAGAVPPPRQRARHGSARTRAQVKLCTWWAPNQPTNCFCTAAGLSRQSLSSGHRDGWSRFTIVSILWPWFSHRGTIIGLLLLGGGGSPAGRRMPGPACVIAAGPTAGMNVLDEATRDHLVGHSPKPPRLTLSAGA